MCQEINLDNFSPGISFQPSFNDHFIFIKIYVYSLGIKYQSLGARPI